MTAMTCSRLAMAAILLTALPALAQTGRNYDVKTMNFYLWCQETQHFPQERCDRHAPEDEKTFEDYRSQIERYEVPYLQRQQRDIAIDRDILHNDPVDNPLRQDPQRQAQSPNQTPKTPSP